MTTRVWLAAVATGLAVCASVAHAAPAAPCASAHVRTPYQGAIVALAEDGRVLFEDRSSAVAYPASVTKLMTLLLVVEDIRAGRYAMNDMVTATADVNCSEPSWVGLKAGDRMSVRDMLLALMVESANDVAMALAVRSAGSHAAFVARMNARAAELGMADTVYHNPNGLPPKRCYPWRAFNVTTAADQLKLARRLLKLPEVLAFTSVKTCDLVKTAWGFRVAVTRRVNEPLVKTVLAAGEQLVKQMNNHNNVMRKDKLKVFNADGTEAVDGLKTGFINAGGSSVVLTGSRRGRRVVVVVLGSTSSNERDAAARRLMTDALGAVSW